MLDGVDNIWIAHGTRVLYLGAASGTTVSHVSDIVGPNELVYAVELSHRSGRDLINMAKKKTNVIPIIEDARHPARNQTIQEFAPAPIAKCHEACVLETEGGVVLLIYGSLNISRMHANGCSSKVCEMFLIGFPHSWQRCNQLYPKATSSHTGCRPSSSYTSNSDADSIQFYLEQFQLGERFHSHGSSLISKLLDSIKSSSHNDAAFQKSSYLSNGAPRFEEYTCDGDIATNENAAASNDDGERHEAVCNEVDNVEMHLTAGRALRERDDGVIDTNASLVHRVECANDAGNVEADNAPPKSTFEECTCVDDISTNGKAAALNSASERYAALSKEVDNMEIEFTAGSASCESGHGGIDTNVSLAFTLEYANDVGNEESGNAPPTSTYVQNSSYMSSEIPRRKETTYVDDIPTNEDAAASNDNGERCTAVTEEVHSVEIGLIVGSTIRERDPDDISTNVSLAPAVECTNDAANEGLDNGSCLGCTQTPVASLKSQGCQKKHQHTPSNEKPSGPRKKQRSALEKLQGATRSPLTSQIPYAHDSPLTRGKAMSLSMSTPEALKLRKTRSGRVVVPSLDAGCQRIVYDMDGTIAGVVGLDSPSLRGSKAKTYARKKKSAEPAAGSKLKTYARKKRRAG